MQLFLDLLVTGLAVGVVYGLVAVGLSMLWTTTDVVNFSHGEFVMLGGFIAFSLLIGVAAPLAVALPALLLSMALLGLLFHRLILRPLTKPGMPIANAILATLGTGILLLRTDI